MPDKQYVINTKNNRIFPATPELLRETKRKGHLMPCDEQGQVMFTDQIGSASESMDSALRDRDIAQQREAVMQNRLKTVEGELEVARERIAVLEVENNGMTVELNQARAYLAESIKGSDGRVKELRAFMKKAEGFKNYTDKGKKDFVEEAYALGIFVDKRKSLKNVKEYIQHEGKRLIYNIERKAHFDAKDAESSNAPVNGGEDVQGEDVQMEPHAIAEQSNAGVSVGLG